MKYPEHIFDEFETMRLVAAGASIARFGDGELKLMYGASYSHQIGSLEIATELFNVLNDPAPGCLVGIPTLAPHGPKYQNWIRHKLRYEKVIQREGPWYSAFVTRPDSAPWIEDKEYLEIMDSCWRDKRVAVVCESGSKILKAVRMTAGWATHIRCPSYQAYEQIEEFKEAVLAAKVDVAVLSVGVTATCLANRLAGVGQQALDLGSVGAMLLRLHGEEEAA